MCTPSAWPRALPQSSPNDTERFARLPLVGPPALMRPAPPNMQLVLPSAAVASDPFARLAWLPPAVPASSSVPPGPDAPKFRPPFEDASTLPRGLALTLAASAPCARPPGGLLEDAYRGRGLGLLQPADKDRRRQPLSAWLGGLPPSSPNDTERCRRLLCWAETELPARPPVAWDLGVEPALMRGLALTPGGLATGSEVALTNAPNE